MKFYQISNCIFRKNAKTGLCSIGFKNDKATIKIAIMRPLVIGAFKLGLVQWGIGADFLKDGDAYLEVSVSVNHKK